MKVTELEESFLKKMLGSDDIALFDTESISKRLWLEPALDVLAIDAPPVKEAVNLVIPKARAKSQFKTSANRRPRPCNENA